MSSDEEALAIGRLVTEYQNTNRRLVALKSEVSRIGRAMQSAGNYLTFPNPDLAEVQNRDFSHFDKGKIESLVSEINEASARVSKLHADLTIAGIQPVLATAS